MLAPITRQFKDLSTPEKFAFVFYCDRCGSERKSPVYKFDLGGFEPPLDEKVRAMLWNQQHDDAYERANLDAAKYYMRCSVCGCRLCESCYEKSMFSDLGTCKECAK